jgi:Orsellinic acid/F9775 biosynthesis cluster protein D
VDDEPGDGAPIDPFDLAPIPTASPQRPLTPDIPAMLQNLSIGVNAPTLQPSQHPTQIPSPGPSPPQPSPLGPSPPQPAPLGPSPPQPAPPLPEQERAPSPDDSPDGEEGRVDEDPITPPRSLLPTQNTVTHHERFQLEKLGLVINTEYKVVICLACQRAVHIGNLLSHLRGHFPRTALPQSLESSLQQEFDISTTRRSYHPPTPEAIAPIFGLKIHKDYHFCTRCGRGYSSINSVKNHMYCYQQCPLIPGAPQQYYSGDAQTVVDGPYRRYFRVDLSLLGPPPAETVFDVLIANRPVRDLSQMPLSLPTNYEDLNLFLTTEHWLLHVKDFPPGELVSLVQPPTKEERLLSKIRRHVVGYLNKVQTIIPYHRSFGILKTIAQIGENYSVESFNLVTSSTIDRYAGVLNRVFAFVGRFVIGWQSEYTLPLTPVQRNSMKILLDAVERDESDDTMEVLIHQMSFSLFAHMPSDWREDKYFSAVNRALVLMSLREQGNWLEAGVITQLIAALIYCLRSTMFYEMHVLMMSRNKRIYE